MHNYKLVNVVHRNKQNGCVLYLKPTDSIGSNKSLTSFEIFGPMARDIIATHANTMGSTVTAF